jgi:predicted metal-dependent hydrolase
MRFWNRRAPVFALALTASLEHLTAIMARRALSAPDEELRRMHPDMAPLWQWHAVEEAEHKAVAFDVLRAVSGRYRLRVAAMLFATFGLFADNLIRWTYFMAKDRKILDPRVWLRTWRFLWGRNGMYRVLIPDYLRWYRRDFHPWQQDDQPLIDACLVRLAL